jgi:hypothetical protein
MGNITIELSEFTKLLRVTLDSKLNFNERIKIITRRAIASLLQCRKAVGPTWGLNHKTCNWMYNTVIRLILTYCCSIWIRAINTESQISIAKSSGESTHWHFAS